MKTDTTRFDFRGMADTLYRKHSQKTAKEAVKFFVFALTGAMQTASKIMQNKTYKFNFGEDVQAFAAWWTACEAKVDGVDISPTTFTVSKAQDLFQRFCAWAMARAYWHQTILLKSCPDASHANKANADAAFIGFLAHDPRTTNDDRHKRFLDQAEEIHAASPLAWKLYRKYAAMPPGENFKQWKHPAVDQWLILIWPLAFRQEWNFRDILNIVTEKFPDYTSAESDFGKHCRRLGLKLPHKCGHPHNHTLSKEHLQLALSIRT